MSVQMRIRAVEGQRPKTGSGRFYKKKIFFRLIILNVIKIFFTKEKKKSDGS